MTDMFAHVNIKILEKEYQISCPAKERKALVDSAELLNIKMREIRDSGKVVGLDRIAVMAALNIANDLIASNGIGEILETDAKAKVRSMRERVETALQSGQQLELLIFMPVFRHTDIYRRTGFWLNNIAVNNLTRRSFEPNFNI